MLRIGGRIGAAQNLDYNVRHPYVLPRKSHLTEVIIWRAHVDNAHANPDYLRTILRNDKYYVQGGLTVIKRSVSPCHRCIRENARVLTQFMSPLPEARLKPAFPFSHSGVEYLGPFSVPIGRRVVKRFSRLFVCLSTRSIHLYVGYP